MYALTLLVAGLFLAAAELASGDFWLLMLAGGAFAAAGTEAVAGPGAFVLDTVVFAAVSVFLIGAIRPLLKRRLAVPLIKTNAGALEGKPAIVVAEVGPDSGLVKIGGQEWTARPFFSSERFGAGEPVVVVVVDGATALVQRGA
ncbi:MAG: NfeD family protein [Segniliparus sp.]|uniref:NfeD family protein n=1 Tax=Segniliparus sp. TaxID=2804064 RepID=UPI003F3EC39B